MQRLLLSDTNGSISWIRPYTCENEKYENDDGKNTAQDRPMSYVHAYSLSDKYKIKVGMVNVLLVVFKKHECLTIVARKTVCVHENFQHIYLR